MFRDSKQEGPRAQVDLSADLDELSPADSAVVQTFAVHYGYLRLECPSIWLKFRLDTFCIPHARSCQGLDATLLDKS